MEGSVLFCKRFLASLPDLDYCGQVCLCPGCGVGCYNGCLSQAAAAAGAREMDRNGALATLVSHAVRYTIRCTAASLGRNTGSCGQVCSCTDHDLAHGLK